MIQVPRELIEKTINYLARQPYSEVAQLVDQLAKTLIKNQQQATVEQEVVAPVIPEASAEEEEVEDQA